MHYVYIGLLWTAETLLGVFYFSGIEWNLHRFVMHKPLGKFRYPYEKHHLIHHRIFKADASYHIQDAKDKRTIPMAWWNWIALIALSMIPVCLLALICRLWSIVIIGAVVGISYYVAYERMHWCMHFPLRKKRLIMERGILGKIFRYLNGHHLLHHRNMGKNFNVVFPFWDWALKTLMIRSSIQFAQARGHSVPDVQPRMRRMHENGKPFGKTRSAWFSEP